MQSAFRVLSLSHPEFDIIIKTMLKCEGIISYSTLSKNVVKFLGAFKDEAPKSRIPEAMA